MTIEQVLHHPVWSMGKKITFDSATMTDKGLEIVEGTRLFNLPSDSINVAIHPESTIDSMVKFSDRSVITELCRPNMEYPMANCSFFLEKQRVKTKHKCS
jgi:1-deoxy-D-xylulose-5-phosphate reductoisomerase